jgi:hypothetical protein
MSLPDPFGTAQLRDRVLRAWADSPARLREDANAEEDFALGGYRDRVIVELAQNAADAAVRAGMPGRLRLTLRDGVLTAANTGAPLDAAGVEALSTLRASSKRGDVAADGTTGRFGVGFAAVVAVSDTPQIKSVTGTVCWSRERTAELAGELPALAGELAARSGHVPVLRLPFTPADLDGAPPRASSVPEGFATVVELPLRDDDAIGLVARLLADTGPALLLALPALAEVVIETGDRARVLTAEHAADEVTISSDGDTSRWLVASTGGDLDPSLLADRPTEERARTSWSVRWAVPVTRLRTDVEISGMSGAQDGGSPDGDVPAGLPAGVASVVHAPTPTDEPLALPALLLASFPLSPDRRHVAAGPLTDFLVGRAAAAYAGLLPRLSPGPGLLDLVPGPAGRGVLDARLGHAIVALLPDVPFLPAADSEQDAARVRPRDAVLLGSRAPGLTGFLASVLPHLIDGPAGHPAYAVLGVRRLPLAELADTLARLDRDPAWWHGLYAALTDAPPEELTELGALPVPLADGRLVRGPRGVLLPGTGLDHPGRLAVLGLRVAHPDAVHPLLTRLGAAEATPRGVLTDPATQAAVAASYDKATEAYYDDDSPQLLADTVLDLVGAVQAEPGEYPWLADLALPGTDGDWYPAGELLLPGSPLAAIVAADAPFGTVDQDLVDRHGPAALAAAGVLSSFALLTAQDVELDESAIDLDLDGAADWAAASSALLSRDAGQGRQDGHSESDRYAVSSVPPGLPPVAVEVTAVRDLDLVDSGRWPQALELLAKPPLRTALTEPTVVRLPGGGHSEIPSYTAWWLRQHVTLGGHRPADLRTLDSDGLLAGLYDAIESAIPALADPAITRALGVRTSLTELLAEPGGPDDLLARLADPARPVSRRQLRTIWTALADSRLTPDDINPPDHIRAIRGAELTVADADDALILDAPDLWPLLADEPLVLAPYHLAARLADLLDLPLASEEIAAPVESAGKPSNVPEIVHALLPAAPPAYQAHDELTVGDMSVPWRYVDGEVHAATTQGLAHALAWATGNWPLRHQLTALLATPDDAARLLAEADLDPR